MPRPPKKEINLSKESMLALMQEIYNELVEQRTTAIRIQNKMLTMMKEPEDMAMIGPIIEKQQKISEMKYIHAIIRMKTGYRINEEAMESRKRYIEKDIPFL